MKNNQIFTETGFLKNDAKGFVNEHFFDGLKKILATAETEADLRTIGCILSNIVGNEVSKAILEKNKK